MRRNCNALSRLYAYICICGTIVTTLAAVPALATSERDMEIAARAVRFLDSPPKGEVTTYIVFDPSNSGSVSDAETIAKLLGKGLKAGSATLVPQKIAYTELTAQATAGAIIIVSADAGAAHPAVAEAASRNSLLSLSTDLSCVEAGHCVVGVASKPKVEIVVNKAASEKSSIKFKSAFMMLVKQL